MLTRAAARTTSPRPAFISTSLLNSWLTAGILPIDEPEHPNSGIARSPSRRGGAGMPGRHNELPIERLL